MDHNHPQSFVGFDPTIQGILDYLEHHLPGYPFLTATDTLFIRPNDPDIGNSNFLASPPDPMCQKPALLHDR